MPQKHIYLCIDLKSFYASVECIERGLNPLTTNLVVADASRTAKTICLAVSPSLKAYGISGRPRLFEVEQSVKNINRNRLLNAPNHSFSGRSINDIELKHNCNLQLEYVVAKPRMAHYIEYSTKIYNIYLKYIAAEDIHVYSIDEVFMDLTHYLKTAKCTPHQFAMKIIKDVLHTTGITATAGIGTNMFLAKVAMDVVAKHLPADEDGVRIAELDEMSYREKLWDHQPITDIWRVGKGYADKLAQYGMHTMGDVALCSVAKGENGYSEALLHRLFGVNAELLIDHAWGYEPTTIAQIKAYKPLKNSLGSGQVLHHPYTYAKGLLIVKEMADMLALDLVEKKLVTNQIVLTVGYDILNVKDKKLAQFISTEIKEDKYGRKIPKHAHGTFNLKTYTSSGEEIIDAVNNLYNRIVNHSLLIRRINIVANNVIYEADLKNKISYEQTSLFEDTADKDCQNLTRQAELNKERKVQEAMIKIKHKYGKNAVLKGMNYEEDATAKDRNEQIGGHKA